MIFINMETTKSIQINPNLHANVKRHCSENGLKLQKFVEKLIEDGLSKSIRPDSTESKDKQ